MYNGSGVWINNMKNEKEGQKSQINFFRAKYLAKILLLPYNTSKEELLKEANEKWKKQQNKSNTVTNMDVKVNKNLMKKRNLQEELFTHKEEMDLETAQTTTTTKLPILKQGEYNMWRLRIEQYFHVQDYALCDIIENGNSFKSEARTTTNADGTLTSQIPGHVTTDEKTRKKCYSNEATKKTQKTLLKQMYENFSAPSIESLDSIFNRLQKIVSQLAILGENISQEDLNLKFLRSLPSEWNTHVVVWRNKPDLDTMSFDDLYNNFKIVEQEVKGTASSSSISTANTQVSPASTQVSTASTQVSTANLSDDTVYAFLASQPNGSQLVYEDLEQIHEDDIEEMDLKWQLALLSMRTRRFFQKTGRKITINGSDTAGYDKSKVECFNCHKIGYFARECRGPRNQDSRNRNQDSSRRTVNVEETSSKAMVAIDGADFDWSYMANEEVPTNIALMAFLDSEVHNDTTCSKTYLKSFETLKTQLDDLRIEFNKFEFNLATYKRGLAFVEEQFVFYKKNEVIFCEQLAVLKRDISYKDSEICMLKIEVEKLKQEKESNQLKIENFDNASKKEFQQPKFEGYGPKSSKSVSEDISNEVRESPDAPLVKELVSNDKSQSPRGNQRNWNNQKSQQLGSDFVMYNKACFVCGSFDHVQADFNYHQRERVVSGNNFTRVNYNYSAKKTHPSAHRNMVPRAVLMKTGLRSLNTVRPVNTAHPKTTVYSARLISHFSKSAQSTVKRSYQIRTALTNKNFSQKVNTATGKFYTARPKAVNTARPNSVVVNVGHPQKEDQGYVDSGFSRHMTGNMSYLLDFKEFDEGYVTFGGGAKGGKIIGKRTLKTVVTDDYSRFTWVFFLVTKDKTSGILKRFITEIENLVDKKVKIIICDNGTKFKNRVMSEFYEKKGIKKEFSVAKTPQQNSVAERRNRTLIKAAITMLADSKLPTTFWTEAVNTACYVHNRVLVVKPHNKTPYELFRGRTPALSFMRPFGCYVTILNTIDNLGKFNGKSDEGFFIRYSLNSKDFRVYNIRAMKVEENLHIRFLEDKPIIIGTNSNDLVGTEENIGASHSSKETGSSQDYIVMPLWKDDSLFDSSLKNASNNEPQPSSDAEKINDEGVNKESGIDDQKRPKNSTQDVNTARPKLDMSNITTTYPVPSAPNTRIHKNHSLNHVIGDVQSGVLTRRMIKTTNEQGFISAVNKGKTYEDLHTCRFTCFISQEEPKKVWTLVDLPLGKRAIGTKWMYMNKKYERGIMIRNKARLVAQGYTQEEGIDYDKVFAPVARIKTSSNLWDSKPLIKDENAEDINVHLYRSMIGSLMYLTSLRPDVIYLKGQPKLGHWYPKDPPFDLKAYSDSYYDDASLDRKSTTGVLLIQNQMLDYGYIFMNTKIFIDKESTICIVKNPVFHSKTKHIEIWHHFIKDSNEKKLIQMIKIHTDQNVVDLLTKAFDVGRFQYMITSIGMLNL
ncbi:putative ribonuclease H-like domain-containing protein [Tanacetum coccineum]|uniref:Ribonuclease H-like domain-containing protein n=1 Tax=Tanacetum coccineum TaxID=301880 RepID=A0ABQ5IN08_9ASTR